MSKKPVKLFVPKDPVQIGTTRDGQPIWMEPKDLIPTPEEDAERWDMTLDMKEKDMINRAAQLVLANAALFIEQTIFNTCPSAMTANLEPKDAAEWATKGGYVAIQDGLVTIVKKNGKILREMTAHIPTVQWRQPIAARVDQLVKQLPPNAAIVSEN